MEKPLSSMSKNVSMQSEYYRRSRLFEVTPFRKIIQQLNFLTSIKDALQLPPGNRPNKVIRSMVRNLRNFKKFANYPPRVQQAICQYSWYTRCDSDRVIVRQGARADYYYFMLSGTAISKCRPRQGCKDDSESGSEEMYLKAGDPIGEIEILMNEDRHSTVICAEPMELLGLESGILKSIYENCVDPRPQQICAQLPLLHDLPLELLQTDRTSFYTQNYTKGTIIVQKSNQSKWIYVVAKGSCDVYEEKPKCKDASKCSRKQRAISKITSLDQFRQLPASEIIENARIQAGKITFPPLTEKRTWKSTTASGKRRAQSGFKDAHKEKTKVLKMRKDNSPSWQDSGDTFTTSGAQTDNSFYVKVETLPERKCFGLESFLYDDMPNFRLISNGVECILMSKSFLKKHMTDEAMKHLKQKVPPLSTLIQMKKALDINKLRDTMQRKAEICSKI